MKRGFVCSAFDLFHAGHVLMLEECKKSCDHLTAGIQVNPHDERKEKNKPIQSILERQIQVMGCRFVDDVIIYETEEDLENLLKIDKFDIRFLGSDYKDGKKITGKGLCPIHYVSRDHNYSSSRLRERIKNETKNRR
ncbi:MAG: adenylyltransferase/cytidyltransferase family protein [Candidatus Izemoplasmatales bacterium]